MKTPDLSKQRQGGMATLVMLTILFILCVYLAANLRTLNQLEREIKLVDQLQQRRLLVTTAHHRPATNNVPAETPAQPTPP